MGACLEISEIHYNTDQLGLSLEYHEILTTMMKTTFCVGLPQKVRVIQLAVSLGGVDSLISNPASMTHGPMIMTQEERDENGIGDGQIRLR